jgi:hypothetical protein
MLGSAISKDRGLHAAAGCTSSRLAHITVQVPGTELVVVADDGTLEQRKRWSRRMARSLGIRDASKGQVAYEGGHGVFPHPEAIRECLSWISTWGLLLAREGAGKTLIVPERASLWPYI